LASVNRDRQIEDASVHQSIANEFPPDPVRENWLRTSNQAQPKYEPDTLDVTNERAVARAYEAQQVRISKETK